MSFYLKGSLIEYSWACSLVGRARRLHRRGRRFDSFQVHHLKKIQGIQMDTLYFFSEAEKIQTLDQYAGEVFSRSCEAFRISEVP